MFIRLMDSQPIITSEALWAESAMEEWWSSYSPPRRSNYFMGFHHMAMIR